MPRVVVFVNGRIPKLDRVRSLMQPGDAIIAADGGTRHVLGLGLLPSLVIGDLDSLAEADRHFLEAAGTEIRSFPRDKDQTDFELALQFCILQGFTEILVIAALGDRLDQTLGNLALLTGEDLSGLNVMVDDGEEQASFIRTRIQVHGKPGDIVSLIPWGTDVTGVSTVGLRWPLNGEPLSAYKSRGLSNEMLYETATVSISSGLLLVIHSRQQQP